MKQKPGLLKIEQIYFFQKKAFFGDFVFCLYLCPIVIDVTGYKPCKEYS